MEPTHVKPITKPAILACTQTTATIVFILVGSLFIFIGCTQLYKTIGLTDEQAAYQVSQDQNATGQIIQQVRWTTHEIITTAIAGAGTLLSGFLARWLDTERKITTAMITAVEADAQTSVKEAIQAKATAAGVETQLHARVVSLT